jgi:hypothetical protein
VNCRLCTWYHSDMFKRPCSLRRAFSTGQHTVLASGRRVLAAKELRLKMIGYTASFDAHGLTCEWERNQLDDLIAFLALHDWAVTVTV